MVQNSSPSRDSLKRFSPIRIILSLIVLVGLIASVLYLNRPADKAEETTSSSELVDARGRTVKLTSPAKRIAIDDSRYLVALGLIHPDPVSLLAAWPKDTNRLGEDTYKQLLAKSPKLADLPKVAASSGSFNLEQLLAANPDLAILSLESGVTDEQIAQIESAGIPVVVLDFFVKPFDNLERSLQILGAATGHADKAQEFIDYRSKKMELIAQRVAELPKNNRPTVFLEPHAGLNPDCCNSPGRGNIGDYINFVGGHNIGSDVIEKSFGKLNIEYVISRDPKVYIATGGPHLAKAGGLVVGSGAQEETAREGLERVVNRPGISGLSAVRDGTAYGFSHQLINSPLDIIAIEAFAKWIHPEAFQDLDPLQTLQTINTRFLATPYNGVYWVNLKKDQ